MKKIIIAVIFLTLGFTFKTEAKLFMPNGEYAFFYSNLAPYGNWIQIDYGTVVWSPRIHEINWSPYTAGRWIWTSDGWYWDSYEPFGYITYHYGRWYYDDYYGWLWVPDYQWAPAWVEWRYDNAYIGWAPLPPYAAFSINIGIHFTRNYFLPYTHWRFVNYDNFCNPYVSNYYIGQKTKFRIFSKTKYRTNYDFSNGRVVNRGVDVDYIRKRTNQRIVERNIVGVSDPDRIGTGRERNSREVRSFIATRDELSRGNTDNMKIQRAERKSSLETSKIDLNRTRDLTPRVRGNNSEVINNRNSNRNDERRINSRERNNSTNTRDERTRTSEVKRDRDIYIPKREVKPEQINKNGVEQKREIRTRVNRAPSTNSQIVPKREARQPHINRESRSQNKERSRTTERKTSERSRSRR